MNKPRVFIGSSVEGLPVAEAVYAELSYETTPTIWKHGIFSPGSYAMESLEEALRKSDFAVLVATPDDKVIKREVERRAMRDNVLLEWGLFAGWCGRKRAFLLIPNSNDLDLPTDLHGLIPAKYDASRVKGDLGEAQAAVQADVARIRGVIRKEWAEQQSADERATAKLLADSRYQAIEKLYSIASRFHAVIAALQRDAVAAFQDRSKFESVTSTAAEEIRKISQAYAPDATATGVLSELEELTKITVDAVRELPFPEELTVTKRETKEVAWAVGLKAAESYLRGGSVTDDVQRSATELVQTKIDSLKGRFAGWWRTHGPNLQSATTTMHAALMRASLNLTRDALALR